MINWIKKKIIGYGVKILRKKLEVYEAKDPKIRDFRYNLYSRTIDDFMTYCINTLGKEYNIKTSELTFPQYLQILIIPLDDITESVVNQVIEGLGD